MKKAISIILAFIMLLSLAACDNGSKTTEKEESSQQSAFIIHSAKPSEPEPEPKPEDNLSPTKEEMIDMAIEIDNYEKAMKENLLRAKEKYIGNVYFVTGRVHDIDDEGVWVGNFKVSLPAEDIIRLDFGQKVTVVGKVESLSSEVSNDGFFQTTIYSGEMSNGYLVQDTFELSGSIVFYYTGYRNLAGTYIDHTEGESQYWRFYLKTNENEYDLRQEFPVNHVVGQDIDELMILGKKIESGQKVRITAKIIYTYFAANNAFIDPHLKDVAWAD